MAIGKPIKGTSLRPESTKDFPWLQRKGLMRYFVTVLSFTNIKGKNKSLLLSLIPIIQLHWKNSGVIWITKYYGEVFRLLISYLNGEMLVDTKF